MNPELHPADYEALAAFRYAMRKFLKFSKTTLKAEAHLTPEQYEALLALTVFSGDTGMTIGQLSERLQVKHHTAVSLVNRMEKLGYVSREAGQTDRRQVFVRLTPTGSQLLAGVALLHRQEMRIRSVEMIDALTRLRE